MPSALDYLATLAVAAIGATAALPGLAAQADKPAEVATRGQREAKDITFGDWQKLCFKPGGAPMLCRTSITGKFPTGQMAVRVDLIEREGAPTARLQLFVPVGMYLQQPAKLTVDQGSPLRVPYSWCLTNGCIAADVATRGNGQADGVRKDTDTRDRRLQPAGADDIDAAGPIRVGSQGRAGQDAGAICR